MQVCWSRQIICSRIIIYWSAFIRLDLLLYGFELLFKRFKANICIARREQYGRKQQHRRIQFRIYVHQYTIFNNLCSWINFERATSYCFEKRPAEMFQKFRNISGDQLTCISAPFSHAMRIHIRHSPSEYFTLWTTFASMAAILSVSIDRFLLVAFPIKHRVLVKGKVIAMWIAAVWLVSCALAILSLLRAFRDPKRHNEYEIYEYAFGEFFIIASGIFYAFTYHNLRKQSKNIAVQNSNESRALKLRILKEKQFLNTIILIACIALVCTMPSLLFFQFYGSLTLRTNSLEKVFQKILTCVLITNFAINPFIYVMRLPNYRKTFVKLYCNIC